MHRKKVVVVALGGTIAMVPAARGSGVVPSLTAEDLIAAVPDICDLAVVEVINFLQLPGAHLQLHHLEELAALIEQLQSGGVDGVVVTQGTDTIEETAFALDCLLRADVPVAVTGAMRNPSTPGADGPANLMAAVRSVIAPSLKGHGCVVVFNDEIHSARYVRKTNTHRADAFASSPIGPIGVVCEDRVSLLAGTDRIQPIEIHPRPRHVRVALLTATLGDDGLLVRAALDAGCDGLVVAAMGGGHVPPVVAEALESAATRVPVILSTRTGSGEVLAKTYGFAGGEIDLQRRGLVRSGHLDPVKATVLLTLLLRHHAGPEEIRRRVGLY
jgi:L-asparaginase